MDSGIYAFTVRETYIEEGNKVINGIKLRKFQEELFDALGKHRKILLRAPTGSGKTFTLILAAIKSYLLHQGYPVIGIYPSRALVYDQARSICLTLSRMGLKRDGNEFTGNIIINGENKGTIKLGVYVVTSESRRGNNAPNNDCWRGDIPNQWVPDVISIILTVPEYPYMFMTAMNKQGIAARIIEAASKFEHFDEAIRSLKDSRISRSDVRDLYEAFARAFNGHWFIDEFHLYSGIARNSMITLVEMFDKFNSVIRSNKSVVFSSATPVPVNVDKVIEARTAETGSRIRKRTRVVFHLTGGNPQEELVNSVQGGDGLRTAVILDRVYYIAELCNRVRDAAVVWGLDVSYGNCRKVEKGLDRESFIIGNQAMSFGIDIDLDRGFIHAHDAETLIQRFGRFGRHGDGEAEVHIFIEAAARALNELRKVSNKDIGYDEFLDLIERIYSGRIDDGLDRIFFSKVRHDVLIRAFSLVYAISQGEHVYELARQWYPSSMSMDVHEVLRPSYDEYFYVFAYRPGGLRGRWCEGGEDELFSMLRNFEYDPGRGCFTKEPLKVAPAIVPRKLGENIKCGFMTFEKFNSEFSPKLYLKGQKRRPGRLKNSVINMGIMSEFKNSYVILLTRDCVDWSDFKKMAELISTYENAIPIYKDYQSEEVVGLALFI